MTSQTLKLWLLIAGGRAESGGEGERGENEQAGKEDQRCDKKIKVGGITCNVYILGNLIWRTEDFNGVIMYFNRSKGVGGCN